MKTKLFTLLLAVAASVGTISAEIIEHVQIGDLYYNLDVSNQTAEVTYQDLENNYSNLTTVNIPSSVNYDDVTFSVTSIGSWAFNACKNLTSVTIPNSVMSINSEDYAFHGCSGLTSIIVESNNTKYDSRNNCNAIIETTTNKLIIGCQNTVIPNSVTSIGVAAFYGRTGLTSMTIPNSVTSIGGNSFADCTGLTSIFIGNSVTSIEGGTFARCSSLASVEIPNSVTRIGDAAFYECNSLTSVTIGNSVTSIGDEAFWGCDLTSLTIPNSVTSIGARVFGGSYTSVTIGSSVTSIGDNAFLSSNLISIVVAEDNQFYSSVDGVLFDKNKTILIKYPSKKVGTSYTIPNSVTSIGGYAFSSCSDLTSVTIPNSVTSIGDAAFVWCTGLILLDIPSSVTSIEGWAFAFCYSLSSVTIPNSVKSIGNCAFQYCYGLTSIEIPNSVTSIGEAAFQECLNLKSITVATGNPNYMSEDDVLFDKDKKTLIQYPVGNTRNSYMIPNTITHIGTFAFFGCTSLTSVMIIPSIVTSIGEYGFCLSPTSIICEAINPPTLGYAALNVEKSIPLYVPAESINLYKAADQWKDFENILPIPKKANCDIRYVDKNAEFVFNEQLTFHVPEAPEFDGFTFLRWEFVGGAISDGLTIQAVYKADAPTSVPEIVTNPSNPAQKLIRNGNVYILSGDKTYTLTGQQIR